MIRVHIEVASAVTRAGLEALLREQPDIGVVSCESDADVSLRDHPSSELPAVVLTDAPPRDVLRAGARAVLPSAATPAQIVAGVYAAASGLAAISSAEMSTLVPAAEEMPPAESLTPREMEVLEMLAEGLSNKMIAYRLNISANTAKFHVNAILAKLGSGTRTEAVMRGIRLGLIQV